jgi:uncharacterized protein HemX
MSIRALGFCYNAHQEYLRLPMNFFFLQLAQQAETLGFLQTVLDGGVSMLLLVALCIVGWLYKKEKEDRTADNTKFMGQINTLREQLTEKIETLFRERLESETENAKIIQRATEVMESVTSVLDRTNDTLDSLTE